MEENETKVMRLKEGDGTRCTVHRVHESQRIKKIR